MNILEEIKNLFKIKGKETITANNKNTPLRKAGESITIDGTEAYNMAREELLQNWEIFAIYPEILKIEKKDRKIILKYIYETEYLVKTPSRLIEKYKKYEKSLLESIRLTECRRLSTRAQIYHYYLQEMRLGHNLDKMWYYVFSNNIYPKPVEELYIENCIIEKEDLLRLNLTNELYCNSCGCMYISSINDLIKKDNIIHLYYQNTIHTFTIKEFQKFRDKNKIELKFLFEEQDQYFKHFLDSHNIPYDNSKLMTNAKFQKILKENKNKL